MNAKEISERIVSCEDSHNRRELILAKAYLSQADKIQGLVDVLREADEYLDINELTNIGSGSVLHKKFKQALTAANTKLQEQVKAMEDAIRFVLTSEGDHLHVLAPFLKKPDVLSQDTEVLATKENHVWQFVEEVDEGLKYICSDCESIFIRKVDREALNQNTKGKE